MELKDRDTFFLDLDKTVWNWDSPVIGAQDLIDTLREKDRDVYFHTDNNLLSREGYAKKLSSMNIPAEEDDIITSGYVTAQILADRNINSVYVIGEQGLIDELEKEDIKVSQDADSVIVGLDRQFNYEKLRKAMKILKNGGNLIKTSTEKTFRKSSGERPHQEPINRALETYTDNVEMTGKPSEAFRDEFRNYFTYIPTGSAFIGDRIADVRTGKQLGMMTGVVMSGETDRKQLAQLEEDREPDFGLTNLNRLKRNIL